MILSWGLQLLMLYSYQNCQHCTLRMSYYTQYLLLWVLSHVIDMKWQKSSVQLFILFAFLQTYKETCAEISYDSSTDVLTAQCSSNATLQDSTSSGYTTLYGACQCTTNIANTDGVLQCVLAW